MSDEGTHVDGLEAGRHSRHQRANWPWIVGSEGLGLVLIAVAFYVEDKHRWTGASEATLIDVGSAFLLAGVLFFVQRRFLKDVSDVVQKAATEEVAAQIGPLRVRLDELAREVDEDLRQRDEESVAAARAMEEDTTYYTVATLLAAANDLGALYQDTVTVQASTNPDELGLEFSWIDDLGDGRFGVEPHIALRVRGRIYADIEGRSDGRPVIQTDWQPSMLAKQVGVELISQVRHKSRWNGSGTLDWQFALRNLRQAVELAIRSRQRREVEGLLQGALIEMVNDEWFITDAGIECPGRGYLLAEHTFFEKIRKPGLIGMIDDPRWAPPARPEGVDDVTWQRIVARAKWVFPIRRGPVIMAPTWRGRKEPPTPPALSDSE